MKWENQISSRKRKKRKKDVKKLKSNDRSFENVLSNASIIGSQFHEALMLSIRGIVEKETPQNVSLMYYRWWVSHLAANRNGIVG